MGNGWDAYWKQQFTRTYWEQPDADVVGFISSLDRSLVTRSLDLGCGIGRHTGCLLDAGLVVTAAVPVSTPTRTARTMPYIPATHTTSQTGTTSMSSSRATVKTRGT